MEKKSSNQCRGNTASHHCLAPVGKKGFRQSAYLQELACYLGQLLAFDEASQVMEKFKGVSLTDKQIERLPHHYGKVVEDLEQQQVPSSVADEQRHYAMMDGSMVFVREEGWKEMKLGRVFPESACLQEKGQHQKQSVCSAFRQS